MLIPKRNFGKRLGLFRGLTFGISISKNAIYSHNSAENEDGLDLEDNDR